MEDLWDAEFVLGAAGAQFVQSHAVRASCHEFVTAMTLLIGLAPLTNGATISIFPGRRSLAFWKTIPRVSRARCSHAG